MNRSELVHPAYVRAHATWANAREAFHVAAATRKACHRASAKACIACSAVCESGTCATYEKAATNYDRAYAAYSAALDTIALHVPQSERTQRREADAYVIGRPLAADGVSRVSDQLLHLKFLLQRQKSATSGAGCKLTYRCRTSLWPKPASASASNLR